MQLKLLVDSTISAYHTSSAPLEFWGVIPCSSYEQKYSVFGSFVIFGIPCSIRTNTDQNLRENIKYVEILWNKKKSGSNACQTKS